MGRGGRGSAPGRSLRDAPRGSGSAGRGSGRQPQGRAGGCHMTTVLCQMMLLSPELWKGPSGSRSVALTDAQADHL